MGFSILLLLMLPPVISIFYDQQTPSSQQPQPIKQSATKSGENVDDSSLLESGKASKLRTTPNNAEIRIISYNIRWRSGDDLKELIKLFREDAEIGSPAIMALQEVDRHKKRSGNTNTARLLAEELGLYYAWAAPPTAKTGDEEETGVAILSAYPLADLRRIVLPHEGPGKRRRVALGASIKAGDVEIRIYSAHAETRISMDKKIDQLSALLEDLKSHNPQTPAIIMGDFNTWQSDAAPKTIKLFSDAGFVTPFGSQKTFSQTVLFVPIDLRLDWIWMRGFEAVSHGIDREVKVSDHWPLWTNVKLQRVK
ncbi:MAG TPA: endonuclease/exonuclease/phosphatase family protein [Pyrinomonadaceae bacterium]|jgi:Metal-dependent hydrolase|nr:endonuclease/exonuclease/phosphatase family protein [Pyrinomonadaceae bacterium]